MENKMTLQQIRKLPSKEKEEFLFNDLALRMIRVEQNVSKSFNKPVKMQETEYYKSLTPIQRTSLANFLKSQKKNRILSFFALVLPIFFLSFFNFSLTGNAIADNVGTRAFSMLEGGLIGLFIVLAVILGFILLSEKMVERRLHKHIKIIEPYLLRKHLQLKLGLGKK